MGHGIHCQEWKSIGWSGGEISMEIPDLGTRINKKINFNKENFLISFPGK